ncbi:DUF3320 domain-containing protein [Massilia sp. CCM 8695]|uniref:DUF3320 domain-containing protein n=1 Tax=Massilia frigida TaxID=2609281 RepID=A0ABX0NJD4_9BURK|nr:DUF3320 domain-containing protein [Massilia frigida]NHZ84021.1 DUF3320 domain-containing protein [Massilia frigida]
MSEAENKKTDLLAKNPDGAASGAAPEKLSEFLDGNLSAHDKLERARMELLDLSARNRLLNIPRSAKATRIIDVTDERSSDIFRMLVTENRSLTFLPGRSAAYPGGAAELDQDADVLDELAQPDDAVDERGVMLRHNDTKLQTKLTSKGLQKRLLDLCNDARTLEEEQGVNILFLTLGTLKWIDPANARNIRYAPLILIPVSLQRGNAAEQFKLRWRQEELSANLSLEAFLSRVHGITLPPFEAGDDFDPAAYIAEVTRAVASKQDWRVLADDVVLGFFSFAKFLMYRDLDPAVWPVQEGLLGQPLMRGLLSDGFTSNALTIPDGTPIDSVIPPSDLLHIVDCDSSQALAVHDVRSGRNLVIQGPPGTGKSQTIANIIASAVADGKSVLFVAEKMAALDVVKRRLDHAGVGDACLELHSNKANKRVLLEELRRTADLGAPRGELPATLNARLQLARDTLNGHADRMHAPHPVARLTPYQVIGHITELQRQRVAPLQDAFDQPDTWTPDDRAQRYQLASELAQRLADMGLPAQHPWRGVRMTNISPTEMERLGQRITHSSTGLSELAASQTGLAASLDMGPPDSCDDFARIAAMAERVASAPRLSRQALSSPVWRTQREELANLVEQGAQYAQLLAFLDGKVSPAAWTMDLKPARMALRPLPAGMSDEAFGRIARLAAQLPALLQDTERLRQHLGASARTGTLADIGKALILGQRIACAPDVSAEVLAASVWDHGIEQAADLAEAVASLQEARGYLQNKVLDFAWETDLAGVRQVLAIHGNSMLRFLRDDWRRANGLVKSVLRIPDIELASQIDILDRLTAGQQTMRFLRENDQLGRAAFGADWRAERSSPVPLRALVAWMRTLRGMGPEPRLIAASVSDRPALAVRVDHVQRSLDNTLTLLRDCWNDCGAAIRDMFPDILTVEHADLSAVGTFVAAIDGALGTVRSALAFRPARLSDLLPVLDALTSAQRLAASIDGARVLGEQAFGAHWQGAASDWPFLVGAAQWIAANLALPAMVARHDERDLPLRRAHVLEQTYIAWKNELAGLFETLCTDAHALFGADSIAQVPIADILVHFGQWITHAEQLSRWVTWRERSGKARLMGMARFVDEMESGRLAASAAPACFNMSYFEALYAAQVRAEPALATFDGQVHDSEVRQFVELDLQRIAAASIEVARAHFKRIPQGGGAIGPLGVLRGEMARRRGHMPIRQLMLKAAPAIQALKPVLMMSPLSVAQFLPPGQLTFDLLVMDEASQIQPVDALGAIARCRQVVVVGDERQLPPTRFFAKMTSDAGDELDTDGGEAQVADIESILGLFTARGLPQRMLRWHYRSRHQSLIAVSNSQFYENKLFIVPSPYTQEAGMGLRFTHVADGVFDSGNTGTNVPEAKAVAEAIMRHALQTPQHSLGVATFSVVQRKAIEDQLELLRRANQQAEGFFQSHPSEPFFVKNLENVQGDERDVILISVGYGRNASGQVNMRFGPLSAEGGERRLNVLISRAKRRCEVFSSITDEDIDLERGKGKGVQAFKLFLRYARTGQLGVAFRSGRDYDSMFEVDVAAAIKERGFEVHPQVGIAGFFIDLAIPDPDRPGRYLLGIECDGAAYHSSSSARDRDRLRQAVLEDHGWIIHRIWSTDWFQRPQEQLARVIAAIHEARKTLDARAEESKKLHQAPAPQSVRIEREIVTEVAIVPVEEAPQRRNRYVEASMVRPEGDYELHEAPLEVLVDLVEQIVYIEGPVHLDEIVVRLRKAWGLQRVGSRMEAATEKAVDAAVASGLVARLNGFVWKPGSPVTVRDRTFVESEGLRRANMLPPKEIEVAIIEVVERHFGASQEEIVQAVLKMFGFKPIQGPLREAVQMRLNLMVREMVLVASGPVLVLANHAG